MPLSSRQENDEVLEWQDFMRRQATPPVDEEPEDLREWRRFMRGGEQERVPPEAPPGTLGGVLPTAATARRPTFLEALRNPLVAMTAGARELASMPVIGSYMAMRGRGEREFGKAVGYVMKQVERPFNAMNAVWYYENQRPLPVEMWWPFHKMEPEKLKKWREGNPEQVAEGYLDAFKKGWTYELDPGFWETVLRYRHHKDFKTWSLNFDLTQPVSEKVTIQAELFTGENLDAYLGGIGQGVTTTAGINQYDEVSSTGGWLAASLGPWDSARYNVGVAMDDVDRGDVQGGDRTLNRSIFGNLFYAINKHVEWALELSHWKTEYRGSGDADSLRIQTALIYKF